MAASGAKVLMLRSVELARNHGVRVHARSTFSDEEGTWVQETGMEQAIISAVTHSETDVVFTLTGIPDRPGVAAMIFDAGRGGPGQRGHDHPERRPRAGGDVVLGANGGCPATRRAIETTQSELGSYDVQMNEQLGKVSLIGAGMRSHPGRRGDDVPDARRARDQPRDDLDLADQDLPMIARDRIPEAVRALHAAFQLEREPEPEPTI